MKCEFEYSAPDNGTLGNCDGKDEIEYGGEGCMFACDLGFELEKEYKDVRFKCADDGNIVPDPTSIQCVGTSYINLLQMVKEISDPTRVRHLRKTFLLKCTTDGKRNPSLDE